MDFIVPQRGSAENPLPGQVTFGVGGSQQEVIESFDILFPLYAPKDSLFFLNPKAVYSDELGGRVSVGLGYRKLFEEPEVILGGNVFYDNFNTESDDRIGQLGFGGELLTHWFDLRANFYLPDQKRFKIDQTHTSSLTPTSGAFTQNLGSQITSETLGFQGYNIVDTTSGVNVVRTTTGGQIQTTRYFARDEAGLIGGDVEGGILLPWLDRYADVRIFGGYYCYDNKFGKNIQGPETRLEARVLPALTFDAGYYSNREIIGSHWYVGMRFNVPFDLANIAEHRSPFAGFWDSFKPKSKDERLVFASRLTENVIRTSRVTTAVGNIYQTGTSTKLVGGTTQDTVTPFTQTVVLTLGGVPITVTHINSAAATAGNGTSETPYRTLTLADTDPVKRNILLLYANSVFNGQTLNVASGQLVFGDASGVTHTINTDQRGMVALPHPTNGAALPIISNPGGTAVTVGNNVVISGLNLTNSAHGITGTPGASNVSIVTISNATLSNMTAAAIDISPATNITLNNLTFQNNFQDVILDAANSVITNVTSTGATNGSISLIGTAGVTVLTNVNISGAGGYGLNVTNPGGTHNITNLNITGGAGDGVDIQGPGAGVFAFDATSSITNPGGTAFNINGGSSTVTFNGTIAGSATGRSVQVQNHTGGAIAFFGNVTDSGLGINLANNTGGSIAFSGPSQKLNTGANTALTLNGNNGANISFSNLAITTTTGTGIAATGANSSVTLIGTNNPGPGAPAFTFTNTSGTYDYSALTSSERNIGLAFDSKQTGTYKLGSLTITNAPGPAAAFSLTGSAANITLANLTVANAAADGVDILGGTGVFVFGAASSITNAGGTAFNINGGSSTVTFNGTIAGSATGQSVQVQNLTGGAVTFSGNVTDTGLGINLANNTGGSIAFSGPSQTLNTGANTALTLNGNNGASISFSNLAITTTTGTGIAATGANSSVTLIGTNNPGSGAPVFTFTNTSGAYDYSALTSSQSNVALGFNNTETGTYKLGTITIASAPGAAAFSVLGSAANITLANLAVTNAAGIGLS